MRTRRKHEPGFGLRLFESLGWAWLYYTEYRWISSLWVGQFLNGVDSWRAKHSVAKSCRAQLIIMLKITSFGLF